MSLLQTTDRVTETDENLLVFKLPDDVTSSGTVEVLPDDVTPSRTVEVLVRAAVVALGIAGITISIATLINASLH